jgi:hypothetical protein
MKITEFIEDFKIKRIANTQLKPNAIEEHIRTTLEVKDYVPFVEKQSIAQIVLETCANIKDGVIAIDSIKKYIVFTLLTLSTYTNLEFEGGIEDLEAYDALCSYSVADGTLLDAIIKTFEKEYAVCNNILNMMTADLLAENNIEKQVGKFLTGILDKLDDVVGAFGSQVENIGSNLGQLDIDKIIKLISKIK